MVREQAKQARTNTIACDLHDSQLGKYKQTINRSATLRQPYKRSETKHTEKAKHPATAQTKQKGQTHEQNHTHKDNDTTTQITARIKETTEAEAETPQNASQENTRSDQHGP